jgi:large subunit ribosomal protein L25
MSTNEMPAIAAATRTTTGKSEAARLRAEGHIPAVAYGREIKAIGLTVAPKDVLAVLKAERGKNTLVKIDVTGGEGFLALIKDFSYHPVTRKLQHVDFLEVKLDREIEVQVPLVTTGKAKGLAAGGILRQVYRTLPVFCVPGKIPTNIVVDVTEIDVNEAVATKDLVLTEGVSVRLPAEQTLVNVVAPERDPAAEAEKAAAALKDVKGAKKK